ncbi:MAG: ABC transporter permease [Alphaproteobacteria bacterium]|nr:MAG: ABC transporter permease [Alphaproteobacteria bacterium]
MGGPIPLETWEVAAAGGLVVLNAILSFRFRLGQETAWLIAGARTAAQLSLMGLVLHFIFGQEQLWLTALAATIMLAFAGREVMARQARRLPWWQGYGIGVGAMLFASFTVTILALNTVVRPDPWYAPWVALPLLGMIMGNTMTGTALALNTLTETLYRDRRAIEARLALGHSFTDAARPAMRHAMRTGLMPIINAMSAAGVVSLPGMMTGQILAGADVGTATRYQILIMFLIAGGTGLGVIAAAFGGSRLLSDNRDRLRLDRLSLLDDKSVAQSTGNTREDDTR